ncbi:hypothetical protein DBB33_07145 [Chromobacterium haemolyticum]|nr:hypothetical protein DBB33_07145 [Chromobacterium haemolyticum]
MPAWFEENRYKEPVTVTENQPAQEVVTVTEIEAIESKPVTVTEIPEVLKAVTVTKNNFQVRYAHPDEPMLTWTGRGRKPLWVQRWLSSGGELADLEVSL